MSAARRATHAPVPGSSAVPKDSDSIETDDESVDQRSVPVEDVPEDISDTALMHRLGAIYEQMTKLFGKFDAPDIVLEGYCALKRSRAMVAQSDPPITDDARILTTAESGLQEMLDMLEYLGVRTEAERNEIANRFVPPVLYDPLYDQALEARQSRERCEMPSDDPESFMCDFVFRFREYLIKHVRPYSQRKLRCDRRRNQVHSELCAYTPGTAAAIHRCLLGLVSMYGYHLEYQRLMQIVMSPFVPHMKDPSNEIPHDGFSVDLFDANMLGVRIENVRVALTTTQDSEIPDVHLWLLRGITEMEVPAMWNRAHRYEAPPPVESDEDEDDDDENAFTSYRPILFNEMSRKRTREEEEKDKSDEYIPSSGESSESSDEEDDEDDAASVSVASSKGRKKEEDHGPGKCKVPVVWFYCQNLLLTQNQPRDPLADFLVEAHAYGVLDKMVARLLQKAAAYTPHPKRRDRAFNLTFDPQDPEQEVFRKEAVAKGIGRCMNLAQNAEVRVRMALFQLLAAWALVRAQGQVPIIFDGRQTIPAQFEEIRRNPERLRGVHSALRMDVLAKLIRSVANINICSRMHAISLRAVSACVYSDTLESVCQTAVYKSALKWAYSDNSLAMYQPRCAMHQDWVLESVPQHILENQHAIDDDYQQFRYALEHFERNQTQMYDAENAFGRTPRKQGYMFGFPGYGYLNHVHLSMDPMQGHGSEDETHGMVYMRSATPYKLMTQYEVGETYFRALQVVAFPTVYDLSAQIVVSENMQTGEKGYTVHRELPVHTFPIRFLATRYLTCQLMAGSLLDPDALDDFTRRRRAVQSDGFCGIDTDLLMDPVRIGAGLVSPYDKDLEDIHDLRKSIIRDAETGASKELSAARAKLRRRAKFILGPTALEIKIWQLQGHDEIPGKVSLMAEGLEHRDMLLELSQPKYRVKQSVSDDDDDDVVPGPGAARRGARRGV